MSGSTGPAGQFLDKRLTRIVAAALEAFSESSFRDATTDEIARRASVSKRDIYAAFPNKHAILIAVINTVLTADDENLTNVISLTKDSKSFHDRLEVIGLALMNELLSPSTGFLWRLISSESIDEPKIGALYLESWYERRTEMISEILSTRPGAARKFARRSHEAKPAARHYLALVTQLPQMMASVGMRDSWNAKSVEAHVKGAVECFLKAYPNFK